MKPRVLRTYKILAVALTTSTAACAPTAGALSGPAPRTGQYEAAATSPTSVSESGVDERVAAEATRLSDAPAPAPAAIASTAPIPAAAADTAAPPPAPPPPAAPPAPDSALLALRDQLLDLQAKVAFQQIPRFRPLCDSDGYPLVGNLVRGKNGPAGEAQPSTLCAEVRRKDANRTAAR